jgi:hypothetical protein
MPVGGWSLRTAHENFRSKARLVRSFSFPSLRMLGQAALAELTTGGIYVGTTPHVHAFLPLVRKSVCSFLRLTRFFDADLSVLCTRRIARARSLLRSHLSHSGKSARNYRTRTKNCTFARISEPKRTERTVFGKLINPA